MKFSCSPTPVPPAPTLTSEMDVKNLTADYVSKYVNLLDRLRDDHYALAPFKVSIL